MMIRVPIMAGVLTVSDRCWKGERADLGGPAVARAAERLGWRVAVSGLARDNAAEIARTLKAWCRRGDLDVILTTGGTGLSPRDVTPEATRSVLDREAPGLAERMRREGEKFTLMAALSRAVCGCRERVLIVNLPGSPEGAVQSLRSVAPLIGHARHVLGGGDHGPALAAKRAKPRAGRLSVRP